MKIGRLILVILAVVILIVAAGGGLAWYAFKHQDQIKEWLSDEPPKVVLSDKPLFKPLDKFVISLEGQNSSSYLMLELVLVTHDPAQIAVIDNLEPAIRNTLVHFFSSRDPDTVRKDLQSIETLQKLLLEELKGTITNYGSKPALDEVLVTKVVLQ